MHRWAGVGWAGLGYTKMQTWRGCAAGARVFNSLGKMGLEGLSALRFESVLYC